MRFNAPKNTTWLISAILIALGIFLRLVNIPVASSFDFLLVTCGGIMMLLGTLFSKL